MPATSRRGPARSSSNTKILMVDAVDDATASGRAASSLADALRDRGVAVLVAPDLEDALAIVRSDAALDTVVLDWDLVRGDPPQRTAPAVLQALRTRSRDLPVFLAATRSELSDIPLDVLADVDDYLWMLDDTTDFLAGRILAAAGRFKESLYPPMFKALVEFAEDYPYSWHTPGHTGGTAFLRTAAGRAFFDFYGERLFRTDLSISVESLGSLLDHTGPIGEAERNAARVFGADVTYFVTNGTSTANRVVFTGCVTEGDVVLVDRNCHKSIEHACVMTGAVPVFLLPRRNRYGIIGPVPAEQLAPDAVDAVVAAHPATASGARPVHAILTNSTYDGLSYDVPAVSASLGARVDRIHFDEAWFGYARFHPLYAGRHAMHTGPRGANEPTLFATQSTHKLLPALSQASMLHVRQGRAPVDNHRFNESFMMHASTSPAYLILASTDIATAMMDGPSGERLTGDGIAEAVAFRKTIRRIRDAEEARGTWFFDVWQPDTVTVGGQTMPFMDAPDAVLHGDPEAWLLRPNDTWHGFGDLAQGSCALDPIKVTVLTPGVADDWSLSTDGIPARIVARYLARRGIVVEKTGDHTLLFLFSMGITKGKWGTLVSALFDFKRALDDNQALQEVLPDLLAATGDRYTGLGLQDLALQMQAHLARHGGPRLLADAFAHLPEPVMTPRAAYTHLVRGTVERVALDELAGRVAAVSVVPYPPGIPLLMPGERVAEQQEGALLRWLRALEGFDAAFPGFTSDNHGVEIIDGRYHVTTVVGA